jgi:ABC-type nitrate/sulfonate/bicarbonate transport system permease component
LSLAQRVLKPLIAVSAVLVLWAIANAVVNSRTLPTPLETLFATFGILGRASFYQVVIETLALSFSGLFVGVLGSYVVALVMAQGEFLESSIRPTLNFVRSIPAIILIPFFLVVIGASYITVVAITGFAIFSKLVIFALDGVKSVSKELEDLSRVSKLNWLQRFLFVQLPVSTQYMLSGLQLSVSRAYGVVVLCGLLIGAPGLGKSLRSAGENARYDEIFAYGFLLALLGVVIYLALLRFETRALRSWGQVR